MPHGARTPSLPSWVAWLQLPSRNLSTLSRPECKTKSKPVACSIIYPAVMPMRYCHCSFESKVGGFTLVKDLIKHEGVCMSDFRAEPFVVCMLTWFYSIAAFFKGLTPKVRAMCMFRFVGLPLTGPLSHSFLSLPPSSFSHSRLHRRLSLLSARSCREVQMA